MAAAPKTCAERQLAELLERLALNGQPCPPVKQLSATLGYAGNASAWLTLQRLEARGEITIERRNGRFSVGFPALGIRTPNPRDCNTGGQMRSINLFISVAADIAALTPADLTGRARQRLYTRPRFLAAWFARAEGWSTLQIGQALGRRDHSTIGSALRYADRWLECDPLFRRMHMRMAARLSGVSDAAVPLVMPLRHPLPQKRWAGDAGAEKSHRQGAAKLLAALQREFPERCAA